MHCGHRARSKRSTTRPVGSGGAMIFRACLATSGILSTAGSLLFSGDPSGNLIAWDPGTGRILWHFRLPAAVSNGPMTYELEGVQYLVVGAGDTLYAFTLLR
jgi:glucose dehydrogenase